MRSEALYNIDIKKLLPLYYRDKQGIPIEYIITDKRRRPGSFAMSDIQSNGKVPSLEDITAWDRHYKQYNRHYARIKQLELEDVKLNAKYLKALRLKDIKLKRQVQKDSVKVAQELDSLQAAGYKDTHYDDFRSRN